MNTYTLTAIQRVPVSPEVLLATQLRVSVDRPIQWVRQHADEIASNGLHKTRHLGEHVALFLEQTTGNETA